MATNLMFKNMRNLNYLVLQCPKCGKVIFAQSLPKDMEYKCCEDGTVLVWLDIKTQRIEIEL